MSTSRVTTVQIQLSVYTIRVAEPICIHCGIELKYCEDDGTDYPQCADCHQPPLPQRLFVIFEDVYMYLT